VTAFPDYVIYPGRLVHRGDDVAVLGSTTGSHLGLPDHEERQLTVIWRATVQDGLLTLWQIIEDTPAQRALLGLTGASQMFDLDQFIGRKFTDNLISDVTVVCNARLRSLVDNQILAGFKNLSVVADPSDPTVLQVSLQIKPIFSLLYINVTFTVTTNL
jgi:hypothetical protein